ncbi:MAG: sn-glycerol-3-phosphate ABC transporter ATP-binding protein UgpC [Dehalococcoidia bacterium]
MARVYLEHVTKRFGDVTAVDDLTLEVRDGEFLVLVGPSGCGKSTALRMVAGLEEITAGNVFIGERRVNDVAPRDRDIAMVFQSYALYPHMSVFDNMAFGLKLRRTPKQEIRRRVQATAELLGIENLLDRKPRQLSGGQRQRVAVGRAIVREPQAFLMDEPLSNLDAKLRVQTRAELIRLHQRLGATTIYVTHDQIEAMTMGSRIAVLRDGVLQQLDTPQTLYERPANAFVAGFIGSPSMNLLRTTVHVDGATVSLRHGAFTIPAPADLHGHLRPYAGRDVIAGLRPDEIREMRPANGAAIAIPAVVDVIEPLGSEAYLYVHVAGESMTAMVSARTAARPGDQIQLWTTAEALHVFDPTTEANIRYRDAPAQPVA